MALRVAQDLRRDTATPRSSLRGKTVRMQCCWMWASQRRLQPAHVLHVAELRIQGTKAHVSLRLSLTPCACAVNSGQACVGTCEHPDDVRPLRCRGRGLWQRHGKCTFGQLKTKHLHPRAIENKTRIVLPSRRGLEWYGIKTNKLWYSNKTLKRPQFKSDKSTERPFQSNSNCDDGRRGDS